MDAPSVRLEVVAGKAAGNSFVVEDELLIGRHAEGVGRLADDEEISRAHARISVDNSGFGAIEDLGSTNGTFVNGLRISSPQTLSLGDTIEIGATTLVVREVPSGGESEGPPPTQPLEQHTVVPGVAPASPRPEAVDVPDAEPPVVAPPPVAAPPVAPPSAAPGPEPPAPEPPAPEAPAPEPLAPEPPAPEPPVEPEIPVLSLRLEVDFAGGEARVSLSEGSEPVRFTFEDGAWRSRPTGLAE